MEVSQRCEDTQCLPSALLPVTFDLSRYFQLCHWQHADSGGSSQPQPGPFGFIRVSGWCSDTSVPQGGDKDPIGSCSRVRCNLILTFNEHAGRTRACARAQTRATFRMFRHARRQNEFLFLLVLNTISTSPSPLEESPGHGLKPVQPVYSV